MSDRGSNPYFPWPVVVVLVLGAVLPGFIEALDLDIEDKPDGRWVLGYLLAIAGAGGLVAVPTSLSRTRADAARVRPGSRGSGRVPPPGGLAARDRAAASGGARRSPRRSGTPPRRTG